MIDRGARGGRRGSVGPGRGPFPPHPVLTAACCPSPLAGIPRPLLSFSARVNCPRSGAKRRGGPERSHHPLLSLEGLPRWGGVGATGKIKMSKMRGRKKIVGLFGGHVHYARRRPLVEYAPPVPGMQPRVYTYVRTRDRLLLCACVRTCVRAYVCRTAAVARRGTLHLFPRFAT
jgi:hypothetical protein